MIAGSPITTINPDFAHRHREDKRHSPAEVLGWVHGKDWEPAQLDRIFYSTRFQRRLNKHGYLRFRHWRLYGELGVARRRANVWLSKEHLTVEFGGEPLSQYAVQYQSDDKHLRAIGEPHHFETSYRTPQLDLWQSEAVEWTSSNDFPTTLRDLASVRLWVRWCRPHSLTWR